MQLNTNTCPFSLGSLPRYIEDIWVSNLVRYLARYYGVTAKPSDTRPLMANVGEKLSPLIVAEPLQTTINGTFYLGQ
jgi:hypothetical protein